jgi:hypothetical protein
MICWQRQSDSLREKQPSITDHAGLPKWRGLEIRLSTAALLPALFLCHPLQAQPMDCDSYARAYADAHVSGDPADLDIVDPAMRGAVVGGAWRGPRGARRGAVAGGALGVFNTLGNDPAGWRGLYDLAYRQCRNKQSPANHRPSTLGDPSYRPASPAYREPLAPAIPAAPRKP